MKSMIACAAGVAALTAVAPLCADTETTTQTPEELIRALEAAGYDLSGIASVNEDGTVSVTVPDAVAVEIEEEKAAAEEAAKLAAAEKAREWDFRATLAFGFSDGNTEQFNINSLFSATRETEETKLAFRAGYFFSQEDGNETSNKGFGTVVHDWYFDEHWFAFADGRFDYDEFKSWRYRIASHGGVGYRLINEDDFKLTPRVGIGAAKEFLSDRNEIIPEGLAGLDLEWNITENQSLVASTYYYPYLDDLGEYRWINTAGWNIRIDQADGLSVTIGFLHEYESDPDPGIDQNDFRLFGGLTFDF